MNPPPERCHCIEISDAEVRVLINLLQRQAPTQPARRADARHRVRLLDRLTGLSAS